MDYLEHRYEKGRLGQTGALIGLAAFFLCICPFGAAEELAFDKKPAAKDKKAAYESSEEAFLHGSMDFYQGDYKKCIENMSIAIEMDPETIEPFLVRGFSRILINDLERGCRDFAVYAERDPDKPEGYRIAGRILYDNGLNNEAEFFFRQALEYTPLDSGLYNNLGSVLVHLGEIDEARGVFEKGIEIDPMVSELHVNLGTVHFIRNDLDAAEKSILKAIEINASLEYEDPLPYASLGDVYLEMGDTEAAVRAFTMSLELGPEQSDVRTRLGVSFQILGENEAAAYHYQIAITKGGEMPVAHSGLALIFLSKGRLNEAIIEFRASIRMNGMSDPRPMAELGELLDNLGRLDEALYWYRLAFQSGDNTCSTLAALSRICEQKGLEENSVQFFRILEEGSCFDATALFEVARRCLTSGIEAIQNSRKALTIMQLLADDTGWKHAGVLDTMAAAYADLGEFGKAASVQRTAIGLVPADCPIVPSFEEKLRQYENSGK